MSEIHQIITELHPFVRLLITTVVVIAVAEILLRIIRVLVRKYLPLREEMDARLLEHTLRIIIILVAVHVVVMSSELTRPFGTLLFGGTAIIGAIAGLAAQPVISDLICGLVISTSKPFKIGDRIELENGVSGIVKDITLRHVVLNTLDTAIYIIPNSKLNGMAISNMSRVPSERSAEFTFSVGYSSDVEKAKSLVFEAVRESPYSVPGHPVKDGSDYGPVYFFGCAESSLTLRTTVYFMPSTPAEILKDDIYTRVFETLVRNGIEIPYNYVNVVVRDSGPSPQSENGPMRGRSPEESPK